ncbi:MAG TPA: hypothetical protein VG326_05465 [Tepidisphaeraceae bacterium]|jgi:hypothetical protein|nr:hypothetical protein [Tepidisphaeraceae bacterium]
MATAFLNASLKPESLSADVRSCFRGAISFIKLPAGTRVFKFTQFPLHGPKGITPWWFSCRPLSGSDIGLEGLLERAKRLNIPPERYARARGAVDEGWGNDMSKLLVAQLLADVGALMGQNASKPINSKISEYDNIAYIGGAWQLYIPALTGLHVATIS